MNKFFRFSSWFAIASLAWGAGYFYNVRYGGELSWVRMLYEQKMAIAQQVQAPRRILIVGGSGAHYTVDAALMQTQLGIPTINIATDGPIGLDVILPSVTDAIQPGDIVILIPEYLLLLSKDGFGDRSAQFGVAIGRPGLGNIPTKTLAQEMMLLGTPSLRAVTKSTLDLIEKGQLTGYYSDPITANGDPTVTKSRSGDWWKLNIRESVSPYVLQRIRQFKQEVESQGATLILGLSWIYASDDPTTLTNIRKTAEELGKIAPVLYDEVSLNVKTDSQLFADTHYHLNHTGRRIRTTELVQQLQSVMGDQLNSPKPQNSIN